MATPLLMPPIADQTLATVANPTPPVFSATVGQPQPYTAIVVAQFDQDVLGDFSSAFKNFIDSGQVWALLIGIIIGYVVRGITTYK